MKKVIAATSAALIGATLLLAPPAQAGPKDDRLFYTLVTQEAPTLKAVGRKNLIKTARETCRYLRSGFTIIDAYDLMEESGFAEREISAFLAGAVVFYCPDQEDNF